MYFFYFISPLTLCTLTLKINNTADLFSRAQTKDPFLGGLNPKRAIYIYIYISLSIAAIKIDNLSTTPKETA